MTLQMFPPSLADQIGCVEREIKMRERLYPRWIQAGKMRAEAAGNEILTMRAVLGTLERLRSEQERAK